MIKIKTFLQQNWFKLLAVLSLLGALGDNPYGYYQFLRWLIFAVGVYSAYLSYSFNQKIWPWIFAIIALLFNPIIPFYLSRNTWQPIDVIVAIIFLVSFFSRKGVNN